MIGRKKKSKGALFNIYINANAGTIQSLGHKGVKQLIKKSGLKTNILTILPPEKLFDVLQKDDGEHPLLIGGGDGTIRGAASIFQGRHAFGILPLGTMNLLAKDMHIPVKLEQALNAYAQGTKTIAIDIAKANDEAFLCNAALGAIPESSVFRENNRQLSQPILLTRLTWFVMGRLDRSKQKYYRVTIDGKNLKLKSSSLVISNNKYDHGDKWNIESLKRSSLESGIMALYSATPSNLWEKIRLLTRLGVGGWRADPKINEWEGKTIEVQGNEKTKQIALDGETLPMKSPIKFTIHPKSLEILLPKRQSI